MVRRYATAFASSLLVHALVVAAVIWSIAPPAAGVLVTAERPFTTFVVPPEDAAFPGLNPVDTSQPWTVPSGESSSLRMGALRIDVARIGSRARVLFPFLTPGLSLDHFLITSQRDIQSVL